MAPPGTLIVNDLSSARPKPRRGLGMEIWHWLCRGFLAAGGWKVVGDWPLEAKVVVTAAPHTSNWDGIWMVAAAGAWRVRLRYLYGQEEPDRGTVWLCGAVERVHSD
jgi:1-acyl-sn-glycerol-3-phosphate acyltransferase